MANLIFIAKRFFSFTPHPDRLPPAWGEGNKREELLANAIIHYIRKNAFLKRGLAGLTMGQDKISHMPPGGAGRSAIALALGESNRIFVCALDTGLFGVDG